MDHELIKLVNKLQDTFNNLGAQLDSSRISGNKLFKRWRAGHASACCGMYFVDIRVERVLNGRDRWAASRRENQASWKRESNPVSS